MILVRVRHLPPDSATAQALGGAGWTQTHYLLADLFHVSAGTAHPGRPEQVKVLDLVQKKAKRDARARARERRRAIEAGEIT